MAEYDIFISYRRVGGADFARQMQLALKNKGYNVFLDFDELKDGVFDRRIEEAIKSSKVFLFILSTHALDRCKNEEDWVRKEIECAILSQCHIVPINPNAVFQGFDDIEGLPYVIKNGLGQHQISKVMMNDLFECTFNEFVQRRIAPIVAPTKPTAHPDAATGSEVHVETDIACRVMRFKEELITAVPDDDNLIHLKKGTHKLTFVSLENEQDNYSQVFTVKDECEFLQVSLTKIRDTRLAKEEDERLAQEEAERRAQEEAERKRLAEDDAKYKKFEEYGKQGFKKDGVVVIPAKYNYASDFSEGLAAVKLDGKWVYIDKSGKEVIPFKYDYAMSFSEGLARVELNGKYGYIDKAGKEVIPIKYDEGRYYFCEGLTALKLNGKWGFIDKTGKEVIPFKYDYAWAFREGLANVKLNGKYGYIDKAGKEVIPIKYDNAMSFSEGLASVNLNGKSGFIDKTGKEVIPFKYKSASYFREGLAVIELNGKYGFIDKSGKEVIPFKYDLADSFVNGAASVRLKGKRGTIDKQGNFTPDE